MPVLTKINTNSIADDAVTGAKIPAGAVQASEIAAGSVSGADIGYLGDGSGNLSGTIANQQLHFGSAFTLTDNLTVNDNLTLGKLRDDGTGQSLTGDGKTLTGTGTLTMGGSFEGGQPGRDDKTAATTSVTGLLGVLGSDVTGGSGLDGVSTIWNLIGTTVASNSATLDQTGLDSSSYDMYAILFSDLIPASDGVEVRLRMGDSSGIDTGGSDYDFHVSNLMDSGAGYGAQVSSAASYIKLNPNIGNAAGEGFSAMLYLSSPATSTVPPMVYGTHFGIINSGVSQGGPIFGRRVAAIDLDRIQAFFSSGNITSGRMSVYGIAHA